MSEGAFYGPPMQYFPCGINVVRINNNSCLVLIWNALSITVTYTWCLQFQTSENTREDLPITPSTT